MQLSFTVLFQILNLFLTQTCSCGNLPGRKPQRNQFFRNFNRLILPSFLAPLLTCEINSIPIIVNHLLRLLIVNELFGREVTQFRHFKQAVKLLFVKNRRALRQTRHVPACQALPIQGARSESHTGINQKDGLPPDWRARLLS